LCPQEDKSASADQTTLWLALRNGQLVVSLDRVDTNILLRSNVSDIKRIVNVRFLSGMNWLKVDGVYCPGPLGGSVLILSLSLTFLIVDSGIH
jgi:hypothetical protein